MRVGFGGLVISPCYGRPKPYKSNTNEKKGAQSIFPPTFKYRGRRDRERSEGTGMRKTPPGWRKHPTQLPQSNAESASNMDRVVIFPRGGWALKCNKATIPSGLGRGEGGLREAATPQHTQSQKRQYVPRYPDVPAIYSDPYGAPPATRVPTLRLRIAMFPAMDFAGECPTIKHTMPACRRPTY